MAENDTSRLLQNYIDPGIDQLRSLRAKLNAVLDLNQPTERISNAAAEKIDELSACILKAIRLGFELRTLLPQSIQPTNNRPQDRRPPNPPPPPPRVAVSTSPVQYLPISPAVVQRILPKPTPPPQPKPTHLAPVPQPSQAPLSTSTDLIQEIEESLSDEEVSHDTSVVTADGKRKRKRVPNVTIRDLVQQGLLKAGDTIVYGNYQTRVDVSGYIGEEGTEGYSSSPSKWVTYVCRAEKEGSKTMRNGWEAKVVRGDKKVKLSDLRDEYLAQSHD